MNLFLELGFVFLVAAFLLNKLANIWRQRVIVLVFTLIGWFSSFVIIYGLPQDISATFRKKCLMERNITEEPNGTGIGTARCGPADEFMQDHVLMAEWRTMYWTAQLLTWIVLPLLQSYSNAGDFTVMGRLKSAVYNNAVYYGIYMAVCVFCLLYAALNGVSLNPESLKLIVIAASNTWGLFLLIVLLGYGLIAMPTKLYMISSKADRLERTYFDLDSMWAEKNEADAEVKEVYQEARSVLTVLHNDVVLREHAQTVLARFPTEFVAELTASGSFSAASNIPPANEAAVTNEKYLVGLHQRVIRAIQSYNRTKTQWGVIMRRAIYLEDVIYAYDRFINERIYIWQFRSNKECAALIKKAPQWVKSIWLKQQFLWHVLLKHGFIKVVSYLMGLFSIIVISSECLFFVVYPTLSIPAVMANWAYISNRYQELRVMTCMLLWYMCVCSYYTIFKIRIYRYYRMEVNHMTDENSLLFSATLLCRLTPALCLNVLGMLHLDSHITGDLTIETQFTKLMGHLDVFLANRLNYYLPILMLLLCVMTGFGIGSRVLQMLGIDQFTVDNELTIESIDTGKLHVTRERERMARVANREQRDQHWAGRLAEYGSGSNTSAQESAPRLRELQSPSLRSSLQLDESRNYADDEPIVEADFNRQRGRFQQTAGVEADFNRQRGRFQQTAGVEADFNRQHRDQEPSFNYNAPTKPPENIFDDL